MLLLIMAKISRILSLLMVGGTALFFAGSTFACICETSGSKEKDFDQAKQKATVILTGRALEVADLISESGYAEKRVKLRVERYWKGELNNVVVVFTGRNSCQSTFVVGDDYLVLAYFPERERSLYTDHCMKSGLVRNSTDRLKWLGKAKKK